MNTRRRWRFQVRLRTMLLVVVPVSVLSAAWAGMVGLGAENRVIPRGFYVLMAAAAPMALMILISLCRSIAQLLGRVDRRR